MTKISLWIREAIRAFPRFACLALAIGGGLAGSAAAAGSKSTAVDQKADGRPCGGIFAGFLGITRMDCPGDCTLTLDEKGRNKVWSFSVEPRIAEIAANSPAERSLHVGDTLVAIDNALITTKDGGRRFANIEPGQAVKIRYRREERIQEVTLAALSRCAPAIEGLSVIPSFSGTSASSAAPESHDLIGGPRIRIQKSESGEDPAAIGSATKPKPREGAAPKSDEGNAGISWACGPCWSKSTPEGVTEWNFSAPVTITKVWAGGPAERAGIRAGDLITGVNGNPIESKQGTECFVNLRSGQPALFTIVRPDRSSLTVTLVPVARLNPIEADKGKSATSAASAQAPGEKTPPETAYGNVGIGLSCTDCSVKSTPDGKHQWEFSNPFEIVGVQLGGPADKAGIQIGDKITAVNGVSIVSKQGAETFSNLRAGQVTLFTITRKDGSTLTLTLVPTAVESNRSHE